MSDVTVQIEGMEQLRLKLRQPAWVEKPARMLLERWALRMQREAVKNFKRGPGGWIDTGGTRQSITYDIDSRAFPLYARVGSNKPAARWGEYGTGLLSEDPKSSKKRHWPPASALEAWAAKKQIPKINAEGETVGVMDGADIAAIIGLRGGMAPRRYLRDAVATVRPQIEGMATQFLRDVEVEAARGTR